MGCCHSCLSLSGGDSSYCLVHSKLLTCCLVLPETAVALWHAVPFGFRQGIFTAATAHRQEAYQLLTAGWPERQLPHAQQVFSAVVSDQSICFHHKQHHPLAPNTEGLGMSSTANPV